MYINPALLQAIIRHIELTAWLTALRPCCGVQCLISSYVRRSILRSLKSRPVH